MGEHGAGFQANSVRICVDRNGGFDAAGRMYCGQMERGEVFCSIADLLIRTDRILDREGRPQSFQRKRSFRAGGEDTDCRAESVHTVQIPLMRSEETRQQKGKCATYDLVVQSRMHASMQGVLKDEEGAYLGIFESELQLIKILMHCLERQSGCGDKVEVVKFEMESCSGL